MHLPNRLHQKSIRRNSLVVRIPRCGRGDLGSTPSSVNLLLFLPLLLVKGQQEPHRYCTHAPHQAGLPRRPRARHRKPSHSPCSIFKFASVASLPTYRHRRHHRHRPPPQPASSTPWWGLADVARHFIDTISARHLPFTSSNSVCPHFLGQMASYVVASNICRALVQGAAAQCPRLTVALALSS